MISFSAFIASFLVVLLLGAVYLTWTESRALAGWLFGQLLDRVARARRPDYIVGSIETPYLHRWYLLPRNRFCNAYLHCFLRDDDDRALHDHPWLSLSFMLSGSYIEHTILPGGIQCREVFHAGDWRFRRARHAHRIELPRARINCAGSTHTSYRTEPCWTLFLTGPVVRIWGFHCQEAGWIPWDRFTNPGKPGETGAGCGG